MISGVYRGLEWLQRRSGGESAAEVAARAGVSEEAVRRATDDFGPFPSDRGRPLRNGRALRARADRWVAMRRRGMSVAAIALADGVSHQTVSRFTIAEGPYPRPLSPATPTPQQVAEWVAARRAGATAAAVAAAAGVPRSRVDYATRRFGPFTPRIVRVPPGVLTHTRIAESLGVSYPTVREWDNRGYLPPPDFTLPDGRRLWLPGTIDRWLPTSGLTVCPDCGARVRRVRMHQISHRQ